MRHLLLALAIPLLLLGAACGTEEEPPSPDEPSASPTRQSEPETGPDTSSVLPTGEAGGDVALSVDQVPVPGEDWTAVCSEDGGAISFSATATPLSTLLLEIDADGNVTSFVASGQDYGPFTADGPTADGLDVRVTETSIEVGGAIEAGPVAGSLTCPA